VRRLALLALVAGVQAVAPAPAAAVDDVNFGSGCQPGMGLPPGFGVNEFNEICTYEVGGGSESDRRPLGIGYGGGGSATPAPSPKPGWIPEVIRPEAKGPDHCIVWPEHCRQTSSGRPHQSIGRDPGAHTGANGGGAGGRPHRERKSSVRTLVALVPCRAISLILNSRLSLETMTYWTKIQEVLKDDPTLSDSPVAVDAAQMYRELEKLVKRWYSKALDCSSVLDERLPGAYRDIK